MRTFTVEVGSHDVGVDVLDGGWRGFQACCWTCDWRGAEHLRGDEPMGTDASRAHKIAARKDMDRHRRSTRFTVRLRRG